MTTAPVVQLQTKKNFNSLGQLLTFQHSKQKKIGFTHFLCIVAFFEVNRTPKVGFAYIDKTLLILPLLFMCISLCFADLFRVCYIFLFVMYLLVFCLFIVVKIKNWPTRCEN